MSELRVGRLQAVGRLEAPARRAEQPQAMQRPGFHLPFVQTGHGGEIDGTQLLLKSEQDRLTTPRTSGVHRPAAAVAAGLPARLRR